MRHTRFIFIALMVSLMFQGHWDGSIIPRHCFENITNTILSRLISLNYEIYILRGKTPSHLHHSFPDFNSINECPYVYTSTKNCMLAISNNRKSLPLFKNTSVEFQILTCDFLDTLYLCRLMTVPNNRLSVVGNGHYSSEVCMLLNFAFEVSVVYTLWLYISYIFYLCVIYMLI